MCLTAPTKAAKLVQKVFELVHSGVYKVVQPVTVFDYSNIEQAFQAVQEGQSAGKVILNITEKTMVPTIPYDTHPLQLHPNATYVLAGGLGGIGRGLAVYLAEHGAKHLAFFSRTGGATPEAQQVLNQLRERHVQANVYACDITDKQKLKATLSTMQEELPPIRGVIQAAMVLRDGLFESMPYENWTAATRPKIAGSWNLHEAMPAELDFFVMLSSIAGIMGNRGQANYAAGCTYQDALAHHRRSLGLPAHVIDLGAVSGMGWFEENKAGLASTAAAMERLAIRPDKLFRLVKSAITGFSDARTRMPTQVVAGIGTGVSEKHISLVVLLLFKSLPLLCLFR